MAHLGGSCHCGRITVAFETAQPPEDLHLRACQCSFCRKHGALTVSDPRGNVTFTTVGDAVSRYRFGTCSADFIVCRHCGAYVGVLMTIDGRTYGVVNANTLDERASLTQTPIVMNYDHETADARAARRKTVWSPAELVARSRASAGASAAQSA